MTTIVKSKIQALLELVVVAILVGIALYAPSIINGYYPEVSISSEAVTTLVTFIAYEFLSPEGLAFFKQFMSDTKARISDDNGDLSVATYFLLGAIALIAIITYVLIHYLHIDFPTMLTSASAVVAALTVWFLPKVKVIDNSTTTTPAGVTIVDDNRVIIDILKWTGQSFNDAKLDLPGNRYITAIKDNASVAIDNARYYLADNTVHAMSQLGTKSWIDDAFPAYDDPSQPEDSEHRYWVRDQIKAAVEPLLKAIELAVKENKATEFDLKIHTLLEDTRIAEMKAQMIDGISSYDRYIANSFQTAWDAYLIGHSPSEKLQRALAICDQCWG